MKNKLISIVLAVVGLSFLTTASADHIKFSPGTKMTVQATITVIADANGELQLDPSSPITIGGGGSPVPVNPDNPDPIGPTVDRAKEIKDAAVKVNDPGTAKNLGALYLGLAEQVRASKYQTVEQLSETVKQATDLFLSLEPTAQTRWKPVRDLFQSQWTLVQQSGGTLQDYAQLLEEVGLGLDAASPGEQINPLVIVQILSILIEPGTIMSKLPRLLPLILQLFAFQQGGA